MPPALQGMGILWINVRERSAVLGISKRTDCMLGSVSLAGTPCIGRARDRNGGRVGRSGTKEDMGPQRVGVDVERGGEQTGEIEMAWGDVQGGFIDVNGKRMMAKSAHLAIVGRWWCQQRARGEHCSSNTGGKGAKR